MSSPESLKRGRWALTGKHTTHIDRIGALTARNAALHAVQTGAEECPVQVTNAPNCDAPLEVNYRMEGRGERLGAGFFAHSEMVERSRGGHFLAPALPAKTEGHEAASRTGIGLSALLHSAQN